nr:hypothetical protein [Tanacetum cinerariifolium]GEZ31906.1 hypothetical protein [Tanacetum cinerariifolium]
MVFWFYKSSNTDDDTAFGGEKPEFEGRKHESEVHVSLSSSAQTKKHDDKTKREAKGKTPVESSTGYRNLRGVTLIQDAEGHTREEGIDYEEFFALVARIEAISVAVDNVPVAADEPTIPSPTSTTPPPPPSQDLPFTSQRVEHLERDKIAQTLEITKLKQRVKKLERRNKLKVSKLRRLKRVETSQRVDTSEDTVMDDVSKPGRIIANMDADEDVTLKNVANIAKEVVVDVEIEENADV